MTAFPGQVTVLFDAPQPANIARAFFSGLGGSVLAQLPTLGYYLVGVTPGQESAFIEQARANPDVYRAFPHLAGSYTAAGATVIDVGTNRLELEGRTVTVGDADPGVREVAAHLTPVPGGVGPMTVAMVVLNAVALAKSHQ